MSVMYVIYEYCLCFTSIHGASITALLAYTRTNNNIYEVHIHKLHSFIKQAHEADIQNTLYIVYLYYKSILNSVARRICKARAAPRNQHTQTSAHSFIKQNHEAEFNTAKYVQTAHQQWRIYV